MTLNKSIISIETSSNICGVSLVKDGECIGSVENNTSRKHSELLPIYFNDLKKNTKFNLDYIDAIAVNIGPGSFTGLRIGLGFAKGIAFSKNLPIIPISSMLALAYSLRNEKPNTGLIFSHSNKVFSQKIKWIKDIPYPENEVRVMEWKNIHNIFNKKQKAFHLNCERLPGSDKITKLQISSLFIGLLANKTFETLIERDPSNLVPNYVAPFEIKTNNDSTKSEKTRT